MGGGRVNRSWCMGVVSHSYGWLCVSMDGASVGRHAGQNQEGGRMSRVRNNSRVPGGDTDNIRSHRLSGAQLWAG